MHGILAYAFAEAASNAECARDVRCQRLLQFLANLGGRRAEQTGSRSLAVCVGATLQLKGQVTLARDGTHYVVQPCTTRQQVHHMQDGKCFLLIKRVCRHTSDIAPIPKTLYLQMLEMFYN